MDQHANAGALVSRPKGIVLRHWGVVLADDRVLHNTPGRGEHVSTLEEFGAGQEVTVHAVDAEKRPWVLRNARVVLANPRAYDLFSNNCEHTVTRIVSDAPSSPQLRLALLTLAVCVFLGER